MRRAEIRPSKVLETGIATAAAMAGDPGLAPAAGFLPMVDYYLSQVRGRKDNVADMSKAQ